MSVGFRIVLSAVLVGILVWSLDLGELLRLMAAASPAPLGVAFLFLLLQQALMILAWWELLAAKGAALRLTRVGYVFLVSNFLSVFLPSSAAGDVLRVYGVSGQTRCPEDALSSMLVLRYVGLLTMLGFGLVAAVLPRGTRDVPTEAAVALLFLGALGAPFGMAHGRIRRWVGGMVRPWPRIHGVLQQLHRSILEYRRVPRTLARVGAYSVGFHLLRIATFYFVGVSLGISVELLAYFLYIPVIFLAAMLPVSVAGLGIAEGGFVFMFLRLGLPPVAGLSLSLLAFALSLGVVLLGGVCYLAGGPLRQTQAAPSDPGKGKGALPSRG